MNPVTESQNYKNITSTTTVYTGTGGMLGIFVASTTGGTLAVSDGASAMVGTFSPVAGTFYPLPGRFNTSLVVTVGGTLNATVFWAN
jgi:hypothetical protein